VTVLISIIPIGENANTPPPLSRKFDQNVTKTEDEFHFSAT